MRITKVASVLCLLGWLGVGAPVLAQESMAIGTLEAVDGPQVERAPAAQAASPVSQEPASPGGAAVGAPALATVAGIDIARYAGDWYGVAAMPDSFYQFCRSDAVVRYQAEPGRGLRVESRCQGGDGSLRQARGMVRVKHPGFPNSRLEVRHLPDWLAWLPLAWQDFWIIELDSDYRYVMAASPDRSRLWILSRSPGLDDSTYDRLLAKAREQGFDVGQLKRMPHGGTPPEAAETAAN